MKFAIITHVPHIMEDNTYFAYAPYVQEMNLWTKTIDDLVIVAPVTKELKRAIDTGYLHENIEFISVDFFDVLSIKNSIRAITKFPKICWALLKAMRQADHIHIRCPGNLGLLGCFVQILFPSTPKTAKYAGNWDPQSKQPRSYRLQKWILSNTFLTRKMQVLIYGEWPNQSKNIKPFFTATYSEKEKQPLRSLNLNGNINFIFVGSLVVGKNPLYAIQLVEYLLKNNHKVSLNIYGDGVLKAELQRYIEENYLGKNIFLHGNQNANAIKKAYQNSHFVILPSKSEGWPKAIAEGMFWGSVPMVTAVSCVPFMLAYGRRGILLQMDFISDYNQFVMLLKNETLYQEMRIEGARWSRSYTTGFFETEIKRIMKN